MIEPVNTVDEKREDLFDVTILLIIGEKNDDTVIIYIFKVYAKEELSV
jgi:hypothetical protein